MDADLGSSIDVDEALLSCLLGRLNMIKADGLAVFISLDYPENVPEDKVQVRHQRLNNHGLLEFLANHQVPLLCIVRKHLDTRNH